MATVDQHQSPPWVSILLVCHNDGKWLARCLESIRSQTIFDRVEVIIADNASQDGSDKVARELIAGWQNASLLSTGGDFGFCVGTNRAASQAQGKYLFVLNPDTWLEPACVEELYKCAEASGAGAAGPTILNYDDNSLQSQCPAGFDFCGNLLLPPKNRIAASPFSAGGFFFINRDLFSRIGSLDEVFFMYCEEQDLAWRIRISGAEIRSVPSARIHHRGAVGVNPAGESKPVENRTSTNKRFLSNRNRLLVTAKNCQHMLLLMLIPCAGFVALEGLATWLATRNWALAKAGAFNALSAFWRLRRHIRSQRRMIASFRKHGDFWMLRFFRFGFGRSEEIARIFKAGFPRFN